MNKFILAVLVLSSVPAFAEVSMPSGKLTETSFVARNRVRCAAQNLRGGVFWEVGAFPEFVRARAMARCEAASISCRSLGCHEL